MSGLPAADWTRAELYAPLARCDRQGFAWEWLRRSSAYREACGQGEGEGSVRRFGLHRFEPSELACPIARPIWRADADPAVLTARAVEPSDDSFGLASLLPLATCHVDGSGLEHWLFSDGWRQIRLDLVGGTLGAGPVKLRYRLSGLRRVEPQLRTLGRLIGLARTGRFLASQFSPEQRAARWALVLRVHDALIAGATQRQIAECLFDLLDTRRWRITAPSWRRRVQRLVEAARIAAKADPHWWLQGRYP